MMFSQLRTTLRERLWIPWTPKSSSYEEIKVDHDEERLSDELQVEPLVPNASNPKEKRELLKTLRWLKLATTISTSLLIFICFFWILREVRLRADRVDKGLHGETGFQVIMSLLNIFSNSRNGSQLFTQKPA
jgi:hypothetical protein